MDVTMEQLREVAGRLDDTLLSAGTLLGGAHNLNIVLHCRKDRYVMRIAPAPRAESIRKEFEFLERLDGGFGPRVYLFDDSRSIIDQEYLVEEFIQGDHLHEADRDFVERMADFYGRLHEKELCEPIDAFESGRYSLLRPYDRWVAKRYLPNKALLPDGWERRIDAVLRKVHRIVEREDDLFADRECFSIVQRDPSPGNVFLTDDGIRLVDWEFVRYDAPEWDMVAFMWAWELSEELREVFLRSSGYPDTPAARHVLAVCELVHICIMLAWRVERICKVRRGDIPEGFTHGSPERLIKDMDWIVPQVERLEARLR